VRGVYRDAKGGQACDGRRERLRENSSINLYIFVY